MENLMENIFRLPANDSSSVPGNRRENADQYRSSAIAGLTVGYVSAVVLLLGLCGNILIIFVLKNIGGQKTAMCVFMVALAVTDCVFLLLLGTVFSASAILWQTCRLFREGCDTFRSYDIFLEGYSVEYLEFPCQTAESWLLLSATLDRYIAVCWPHLYRNSTRKNAVVAVIVLFVATVLLHVPGYALGTRAGWGIQKIITLTAGYMIPLVLLTAINTRLIVALILTRRRHRQLVSHRRHSASAHSDGKGVRGLAPVVAVVIIYWICQTPYFLEHFAMMYYWNFGQDGKRFASFQFTLKLPFRLTRNCLLIVNSSVNFLVYYLLYRRFRHTAKGLLCQGPKKRHRVSTQRNIPS